MCLHVFLLGFIIDGTLCTSWIWVNISFPMLGNCFIIIFSNVFSDTFSSSETPCNSNAGLYNVLDVSETVLISFHSLFCSIEVIFTILYSSSLIHSSVSVMLMLISSSIFFFSVIVLFITDNLFFATAAKSLQSCPTLCDPIDGSPTGPSVPGILQARILEWVAISFSNVWKWKVKVKLLSDPMDCSLPDSSIHGIFQARVLEWDAIAFSNLFSTSC